MSESSTFDFSKFVPGFDFLKKLSTSGATALPQASSWIAPTLDAEELERRIQELKAVHFWLDQNTKAVSATIQALEVQRMTLATLKGMNFSMNELAEALKAKPDTPAKPSKPSKASPNAQPKAEDPPSNAKGAVDPLAWWGSLTEQFQHIAGQAMQDMQRHAQAAQAATPAASGAKQPAAAPTAKAARKQPATRRKSSAKG
jgi:hypothetical protein